MTRAPGFNPNGRFSEHWLIVNWASGTRPDGLVWAHSDVVDRLQVRRVYIYKPPRDSMSAILMAYKHIQSTEYNIWDPRKTTDDLICVYEERL